MYSQSIIDQLEIHALKTPEKIALISKDGQLSYQRLHFLATQLASLFLQIGLQGERVAIHLPNSLDLAVIYLAALMTGSTVVPLSIALKKAEIETILSETAPIVFIGNENSSSFFEGSTPLNHFFKHVFSLDKNAPAPFQTLEVPVEKAKKISLSSHDSPAAIFYTSGSTNKPKGVVHSERSLTAMMDSMVDSLDLTAEGRFLMFESMSNCSGYTQSLLPLLIGATTLIRPSFSIEELIQAAEHHPTRMSLMGKGNHDITASSQLKRSHFSEMTLNLSGGDKISKDLMDAFKEKTGIPIRLGYGMSECLLLTVNKSDSIEKIGSVGQAAKNSTIRLLDPHLNLVSPGQQGEIWVKGPNLMLGYWKEPELTAKVVVDGWLRTGDLAYCDLDGFYWFAGRIKQMIIREGDNISPFEIEEVLAKHPAVYVAGVVGVPHPTEGEVPHAFVELKPGERVTEEELLAFAKKHLEDYKVPAALFILDKLPRTLSGKVAREQLKKFNK